MDQVLAVEHAEDEEPLISIHALTGESAFQTLKVKGRAKNVPILILIDSGSSHIFMDAGLAAKIKCKVHNAKPFNVAMADGNKVQGTKGCKDFTWYMQGEVFTTDVLVMPLAEYDLILGVQWLKPLGQVTWDFQQKYLQFQWKGRPFKVDMAPKPSLTWMEPNQIINALQISDASARNRAFVVQLSAIKGKTEGSLISGTEREDMQKLLEEFPEVFAEPTELPPKRLHDHHMTGQILN